MNTLKTCPNTTCVGYGRRLWPSHDTCPRCADALVADTDVLADVLASIVDLPATSWGKRRVGLCVTSAAGDDFGWRRVAVRNAVKILPWQLAHVAVARIITGAAGHDLVQLRAVSAAPGGKYHDGLA